MIIDEAYMKLLLDDKDTDMKRMEVLDKKIDYVKLRIFSRSCRKHHIARTMTKLWILHSKSREKMPVRKSQEPLII